MGVVGDVEVWAAAFDVVLVSSKSASGEGEKGFVY